LETIASTPLSGPSSIDLSWDPNLESDLLGYNVFRADAPSGAFRRLNPAPLSGPAYRDLTAVPGHPYRYRVTAIDRNSNESPPSAEVHEILQAP
jgi:fibronectin type 3 domain-containing protein